MAQKPSDTLNASSMVQHGRSEGVPKHVWRPFLGGGHRAQPHPHYFSHLLGRELATVMADEERVGTSFLQAIPLTSIALQALGQLVPEGNHALLVALSRHFQLAVWQVDGGVGESYELRQAYARLIERHNDGTVEHSLIACSPLDVIEQSVHFVLPHELRKGFLFLGAFHLVGRVAFYELVRKRKAVEGAKRRQSPVDTGGTVSLVDHALHPIADHVRVHILPRELTIQVLEKLLKGP